MKINISNPIEVIYLNLFALGQNIALQIMKTWIHLSTYLLFVINLSPLKLFKTESTVLKTTSVKHINLESTGKEIHFLF